jgi:hypothetical protein
MRVSDFQIYSPEAGTEENLRLAVFSEAGRLALLNHRLDAPFRKLVVGLRSGLRQGQGWPTSVGDGIGEAWIRFDPRELDDENALGLHARVIAWVGEAAAALKNSTSADLHEVTTVISEAVESGPPYTYELKSLRFRRGQKAYKTLYEFGPGRSSIVAESADGPTETISIVGRDEFRPLWILLRATRVSADADEVRYLDRRGKVVASASLMAK